MSTHGTPRDITKRCMRGMDLCLKLPRGFDLNAPPGDFAPLEGVGITMPERMTTVGHDGRAASANPQPQPQPLLQAVARDGSFDSPIDVDSIEEEVVMLPSSEGFPQGNSSRDAATLIIDEDLEVYAGRSGVFIKNQNGAICHSCTNKRQRTLAYKDFLNCGVNSTFEDIYCVKKKKVMDPVPEPAARGVSKEAKFNCGICLNELVDASSTNCGHIFCQGCIKMAIQKLKKCPSCRKSLNMRSFHRIYLPNAI